jgi:hypothetical protein
MADLLNITSEQSLVESPIQSFQGLDAFNKFVALMETLGVTEVDLVNSESIYKSIQSESIFLFHVKLNLDKVKYDFEFKVVIKHKDVFSITNFLSGFNSMIKSDYFTQIQFYQQLDLVELRVSSTD